MLVLQKYALLIAFILISLAGACQKRGTISVGSKKDTEKKRDLSRSQLSHRSYSFQALVSPPFLRGKNLSISDLENPWINEYLLGYCHNSPQLSNFTFQLGLGYLFGQQSKQYIKSQLQWKYITRLAKPNRLLELSIGATYAFSKFKGFYSRDDGRVYSGLFIMLGYTYEVPRITLSGGPALCNGTWVQMFGVTHQI